MRPNLSDVKQGQNETWAVGNSGCQVRRCEGGDKYSD
jgi:hypothetical protein